MTEVWEEMAFDPTSQRRIFKAKEEGTRSGNYGTYDFKTWEKFEVRDKNDRVLLETSDSASGDYWCGVFLWFVDGSDGQQVRLDRSDREVDKILDVPNQPIQKNLSVS